ELAIAEGARPDMVRWTGSPHSAHEWPRQPFVTIAGPAPGSLKVEERLIGHQRGGGVGDAIEHVGHVLAPQRVGRELAEKRLHKAGEGALDLAKCAEILAILSRAIEVAVNDLRD